MYEQKKEEFELRRGKIQKEIEEVIELRIKISHQVIPYSAQVKRLALPGRLARHQN